MSRSSFIGVAIVAILALSFTAAAVDTGLDTVGNELSGSGDAPLSPEQSAGAQGDSDDGSESSQESGPSQPDSESEPDGVAGPSLWQVFLSVALLTVGGVVIVYGLTRGDDTTIESDQTDEDHRKSGEQADGQAFVADVPPTNDVYRVWQQFRDDVCADSVAVSPAEVAAMAVADGFDEDAVERLTCEFRAVRYGPESLTDECEKRARNAGNTLGVLADTAGTSHDSTEASE